MTNKPVLNKTMSHKAQKELFLLNPSYKKLWGLWKLKTIPASHNRSEGRVDIIIVGMSSAGALLGKYKYPRNETNKVGWTAKQLDTQDFILKKYHEVNAQYTYNFNLHDDGK